MVRDNGFAMKEMPEERMKIGEKRTTSSTTSMAGRLERRAEMPRLRQRVRSCLASSWRCCGRFGSTPAPPCTAIAHLPIYPFGSLLLWIAFESVCVEASMHAEELVATLYRQFADSTCLWVGFYNFSFRIIILGKKKRTTNSVLGLGSGQF